MKTVTEVTYLELSDGSSCVYLDGIPIYARGSKLVSDIRPSEFYETVVAAIERPAPVKVRSRIPAPDDLQTSDEQNALWTQLYAKELLFSKAA